MFLAKITYNKKSLFLFWLIYFIMLTILAYKYVALPTENMLITDNQYKVRDFDYYMIIIKSYMQGEIDTLYENKSQQIALNNFFKIKTAVAMPLGISPTALIIWLPFALTFQFNKLLSYAIWVAFSITLLTMAIVESLKYVTYKNRIMAPWLMVRYLFFLLSFAMVGCIVLGQTTIMACALFIFMILEIYKAKDEKRTLHLWIIYSIVFLLSIKIPYILLALGILFVFGYFFEFIFSILFMVMISLLIGVWKGFALYQDWLQQLAAFSSAISPSNYLIENIFDTIINFRSSFSFFFGMDASIVISKCIFVAGLLFIFLISFVRFMYPSFLQKLTTKITPQQTTVLLVAIFLLFMPYIGEYEDLLMIVLFVIGAVSIGKYETSIFFNVISAVSLCFVLNFKIFEPTDFAWVFWLMKIFVFGSLIIYLKE